MNRVGGSSRWRLVGPMVAVSPDSGGFVDPANDQGGILSSIKDALNRGEVRSMDVAAGPGVVESVERAE